jgi:hypothetical protein
MTNVLLYLSMSLDRHVAADREHVARTSPTTRLARSGSAA